MEEQIKQSNPILHKYLFTVTTFSKLLAMFLFILFPFVGFYLGMKYEEKAMVVTPLMTIPKITPSPTVSSFFTYPISQTNSDIDISNWKTYSISTNPVNYSIAFPAEWKKAYPGDGGSTNYVSPDKLIEVITESSVRGLSGQENTIDIIANMAASISKKPVYRNIINIDGHRAIIQEATSDYDTRVSLYISGFKQNSYDGKGVIVDTTDAYVGIDIVIDKNREDLARKYIQSIITTIKFTN